MSRVRSEPLKLDTESINFHLKTQHTHLFLKQISASSQWERTRIRQEEKRKKEGGQEKRIEEKKRKRKKKEKNKEKKRKKIKIKKREKKILLLSVHQARGWQ